MLRAADRWVYRCDPDTEVLEAQILFGESPARVRQYSRCLAYWRVCREYVWSRGVWLSEEQQEGIIERVWPVLTVAGTVTQHEAFLVCESDPAEEILLQYSGARRKPDAIQRIHSERAARARNAPRTRKSLLGHFAGPW